MAGTNGSGVSKLDQLKALGAAKRGLRVPPLKSHGPVGDGVALTSIAHPPGLIDEIAGAIQSGKLSLKRGRPKITAPRPWDSEGMSRRTWYRRKKEQTK